MSRLTDTRSTSSTNDGGNSAKPVLSWIEIFIGALLALTALAAIHGALIANVPEADFSRATMYQKRAVMLASESDPVRRDSVCIPLSAFGRSVDAQMPTNARIFLMNMVGPEFAGDLGYYYFLTYYLFPREVAISLGDPAHYTLTGMVGRLPRSSDELVEAGYHLALQKTPDGRWNSQMLKPLPENSVANPPKPIRASDGFIAFLLPIAVALAGVRLLRLIFRELDNVLSTGEWLACGLAFGAFLSTQTILGLRLAGLKLEQPLAWAFIIWGAVELGLMIKRGVKQPPKLQTRQFWWLLLLPAAFMAWLLFRLSGLEGLLEFDAIAFWAFKGKLFHELAGNELWTWLKNPALGYAHLDYPLTASLLHSFTYGALGHVNEFVTKFWNQWMLVLLAASVLGASRFPGRRPWVAASAATIIFLLPQTLDFTLKEGGTIPMTFFAATASLQLAIGMTDKNASRLRLGLLLLMAAAMVKFEGMVLIAMWGVLILLDRDSRKALWPPKDVVVPVAVGFACWLPYVVFRLIGPALHPESAWASLLVKNISDVLHIAPMTCIGFISRRFFNNDFASWNAADNQHAVWDGKWTGIGSLVDQSTFGVAWVALAITALLFVKGGAFRWTALRLFLVFIGFGVFVGFVWSATHSEPLSYAGALEGSIGINGGRYLYPVLMSWVLGSIVLLARSTSMSKTDSPPPGQRKQSQARSVHRPH
ncbi:MAG TPA: hypothetical protein PKA41_05055 [Verrucomicrobiota bacterium]|nr:hypothetical protein [Verrucomicrobiota bacterium]